MAIRFAGQSGNPKKPKQAEPELTPWEPGETEIFEIISNPENYKPKKTTTIRFDPDVREFFESQGPGWQPKINRVLRAYMIHEKLKMKK